MALGDKRIDQDEAQALVEQGQMLSLEQLLALHADLLRGQLLDLELEREQDRLIYEVEVLGEDGRVREFELDAASGELIRESFDD
ncbi:PepSY domain-containing protein [Marinobacterium aestuariivivens]|uniref:PepSY domain-containing protein n=1 Tax=Marinobacterium aestuariivivens TaxID=1698799 RepID=A0ABW2A337_9GAMM